MIKRISIVPGFSEARSVYERKDPKPSRAKGTFSAFDAYLMEVKEKSVLLTPEGEIVAARKIWLACRELGEVAILTPPGMRILRQWSDRVPNDEKIGEEPNQGKRKHKTLKYGIKQLVDLAGAKGTISNRDRRKAVECLTALDLENSDICNIADAVQKQIDPQSPLAARIRGKKSAVDRATEIMITDNLRLVMGIAKKFYNCRLPIEDLVQEGNMGLMRAALKFDHCRGYRFSTYASWWIRHFIVRSIADRAQTIRLPVHMFEKLNRVNAVLRYCLVRGIEPTDELIAERLGISAEDVWEFRQVRQLKDPESLDVPFSSEDGEFGSMLGSMKDTNGIDPEQLAAEREEIAKFNDSLSVLEERDRGILVRRFAGDKLKKIGDSLELSRERIRQLQDQAIARIRKQIRKRI
jgi:RNA polymerase primary sigma factor